MHAMSLGLVYYAGSLWPSLADPQVLGSREWQHLAKRWREEVECRRGRVRCSEVASCWSQPFRGSPKPAMLSEFYDCGPVDLSQVQSQSIVPEKTLDREHSSLEAEMLLDPGLTSGCPSVGRGLCLLSSSESSLRMVCRELAVPSACTCTMRGSNRSCT